ncbi:MAG: type II toxin-antitoxin system VapB family antitoxin [Terriglobia bacterium]
MRRTTLTIDDQILLELKKRAAEEGRTVQAVTNDLLRRSLANNPQQPYQLRLQGWKAAELPGVDLLDRVALFDLMDGR